jgi:hypothetical protein
MSTPSSANLVALRDELVRRLVAGDAQITEAKKNGADTTRWEAHWITLLREYEQICQMLAAPKPERVAVRVAA